MQAGSTPTPTTTPTCTGARCDNPSPDARLCPVCVNDLVRDLRAISGPAIRPGDPMLIPTRKAQQAANLHAGLAEQLLVTMSRQATRPEQPDTGAREPDRGLAPLPSDRPIAETGWAFDVPAADVLARLRAVLTVGAQIVLEHRHGVARFPAVVADRAVAAPSDLPGRDVAELAGFVARYRTSVAASEQAAQLAADVARLVRQAQHVVSPRSWEYMGPCNHWHCEVGPGGCSVCAGEDPPEATHLYVERGAPIVTCWVCGRSYDTAERRRWLLAEAEEQLVTAAHAAEALPRLLDADLVKRLTEKGQRLTPREINRWGLLGKVHVFAPDPRERELDTMGRPKRPAARYKVGELLGMLVRVAQGERA